MRILSSFTVLLLVILITSCNSKFRKIEKNPDWRVKYEGAMYFYEKEDYYRASILFESILPIVRGLPEGEKVQFYLAYCQYHDRLYFIAAEYFKTFYETYGRSKFVEEARFMYANALYKAAPSYDLDQSSGIEAMSAMQQFLNRYPNSSLRDEAVKVINNCQQKLEKKGFENARQYYKMRRYKAAVIALESFERNFPDSKYREEADFIILSAQFKLAEESIYSKQEERYQAVIEKYKELVDTYQTSSHFAEAEKYYVQSQERLLRFKKDNS